MRAIVQRVAWARVTVDARIVGKCGPGLLLLVGAHKDDADLNAEKLADRVVKMRIFNDAEGKMNLALVPGGAEPQILAISNFTVYGDAGAGRRPSFIAAAPYEEGKLLFDHFVASLRALGLVVDTGEFGAHMHVELLNDGPVTLVVDA